jgi:hypothetical protein
MQACSWAQSTVGSAAGSEFDLAELEVLLDLGSLLLRRLAVFGGGPVGASILEVDAVGPDEVASLRRRHIARSAS